MTAREVLLVRQEYTGTLSLANPEVSAILPEKDLF